MQDPQDIQLPDPKTKKSAIAAFLPSSFRFSPLVTFGALILSIVMLLASHWQWTRYKYKIRLLESFRLNSISMPIAFPPVQNTGRMLDGAENLKERRVELSGVFDYAHQLIVTNREGQIGTNVGPGHYLLTPLLLNEGAGPAVIVNRGFIPFADREPETWTKYSFYSGITKIEGVAQSPIQSRAFGPKNPSGSGTDDPAFRHLWFFEEIPAMAKQFSYPVLENIYVQQLGGPPQGEFPREAVRIQVPPATHFGYTIEWILLAIATWAAAFFYQCLSGRRRRPNPSHNGFHPGTAAAGVLLFFSAAISPQPARATTTPGTLTEEVGIIQHLGGKVNLSLPFRGEDGVEKPLSAFAVPGKPLLIVPVYYGCPRLCTLTFNGVLELLKASKLKLGEEFSVLAFSINPDETPELAREKAAGLYPKLKSPDQGPKGFPLLTGKQESIQALTAQLGFIYRREGMDFAHSPGLMVVTPEGRISRYFLGVDFPEPEVRYSLVEASSGQIGGLAEQIFLYCFRFDETKGKYTPAAWRLMRVGSGLCVAALFGYLTVLWRREFRTS